MTRRGKPRTPYLNPHFAAAMQEFAIALKKTAAIRHRGDKGRGREEAIADFFNERLPKRFRVCEGEIVDLDGCTSPQMDLIFYDEQRNFAFSTTSTSVLPAEAALATIEVKSKLTAQELEKSVTAARTLRALRPYGERLGGRDAGKAAAGTARYYHSVFAYESDLSTSNWLLRESQRASAACGSDHAIDSIYVCERGLINLGGPTGIVETADGAAIAEFYFSILNFIQREGARRADTPFERYTKPDKGAWHKL